MKIKIANMHNGPIEPVGSWGRVLILPGASGEVEGNQDDLIAMRRWLGQANVTVDGEQGLIPDSPAPDHDPEAERRERIKAVMRVLDTDSEEHMTKHGEPRTSILEAATGYESIEAEERTALWEEVQGEG